MTPLNVTRGAFNSDICVQKVCIQGKTVRKMKNVSSLLLIERNLSLVQQHSQEMGAKPLLTPARLSANGRK